MAKRQPTTRDLLLRIEARVAALQDAVAAGLPANRRGLSHRARRARRYARAAQALAFIIERDGNLTVEDIGEELGIGRRQVYRLPLVVQALREAKAMRRRAEAASNHVG